MLIYSKSYDLCCILLYSIMFNTWIITMFTYRFSISTFISYLHFQKL